MASKRKWRDVHDTRLTPLATTDFWRFIGAPVIDPSRRREVRLIKVGEALLALMLLRISMRSIR